MTTAKTGNQWDTFGAFAQDQNRERMSNFPNSFITNDATGTPVPSPVTVTTGTTITIPVAATQMTITSTAALRISEKSDVSQYFTVPANTAISLPVVRQTLLYLKQDASSCAVSFFFSNV